MDETPKLSAHFNVSVMVCINKHDLNFHLSGDLENIISCKGRGVNGGKANLDHCSYHYFIPV